MNQRLLAGDTAPDFSFDTPWKNGLSLYGSGQDEMVLFFLRYMGCPLCQLKISELVRDRSLFAERGLRLLVVLQSQPEVIAEMYGESDMPFTIVCDPEQRIFNLYGVLPGSVFRYVTPSVIGKVFKAKKQGIQHGKSEGRELQLPAVFAIDKQKRVTYAYYGKNIGDLPDAAELLQKIN